jgi:hypothetical protein
VAFAIGFLAMLFLPPLWLFPEWWLLGAPVMAGLGVAAPVWAQTRDEVETSRDKADNKMNNFFMTVPLNEMRKGPPSFQKDWTAGTVILWGFKTELKTWPGKLEMAAVHGSRRTILGRSQWNKNSGILENQKRGRALRVFFQSLKRNLASLTEIDLERGFGVSILDRRGRRREKPGVGIDRDNPSIDKRKEQEKNYPQKIVSAVVVKNVHDLKKVPKS